MITFKPNEYKSSSKLYLLEYNELDENLLIYNIRLSIGEHEGIIIAKPYLHTFQTKNGDLLCAIKLPLQQPFMQKEIDDETYDFYIEAEVDADDYNYLFEQFEIGDNVLFRVYEDSQRIKRADFIAKHKN